MNKKSRAIENKMDFVTRRKFYNKRNRSQDDLSLNTTTGNTKQNSFISLSSTTSGGHGGNSLPDLSTSCPQEFNMLKATINDLEVKLTKAYADIEELTMRNNNLESKLIENERKVNELLELYSSRNLMKSKKRDSIRKSMQINSSAVKRRIDFQAPEITDRVNTDIIPSDQRLLLSNKFTQTETLPANNSTNEEQNSKIWIVGGRNLVDLGSQLILQRTNTKYEQYTVYSLCKPGATTAEILSSINSFSIKKRDKVIISIGENDSNPLIIGHELYCSLKNLELADILVTSTEDNPFLNSARINNSLELTCRLFRNCNFIRSDRKSLCKLISHKIDCLDYDRKFLSYRVQSKIKNNCKQSENINLLSKTTSIKPVKNLNVKTKTNITSETEKQRKGTIPYYFKKKIMIKPQQESFRKVPFYFHFGVKRNLDMKASKNDSSVTSKFFRE